MKLRIQGNSLRLRLTQKEVQRLQTEGLVEEHLHFGPGQKMSYRLLSQEGLSQVQASFDGACLQVALPQDLARQWTETAQVGISHEQPLEEAGTLSILIEKDFRCLHKRPGEDESDHYPHPLESS
ncbi:MAG: hypothetical protein D6730_11730 [Bacteroidetes bacterium]|nr:MAG: hypothetical protein D6730_11730 [Bacteroidota bacterium]